MMESSASRVIRIGPDPILAAEKEELNRQDAKVAERKKRRRENP
jgi:hypothetical protein